LFVVILGAIVVIALVLVLAQSATGWVQGIAGLQAGGATREAGLASSAGATSNPANRIGIVSGHRGNDSGTVCLDGLTEAQVNFDHATRVASFLRAEGYVVDILDEFDARLKGYRALALVSIHADSCTYINDLATGFKVARALESRVPETEDELVACLTARYKQATGLRFHANTVTRDMTQYHAFGEIAPETPAAIIETGFMYLDRPILTRKPEQVAKGVTDGVLCFLRNEAP
jgi:N-acetylmuramoyl-L-alanine amidase